MSINCLLTNDVVLEKLVALVDAKSGNVASVSSILPLVATPTTGDVVVSLPIAGTWTATNNVVKSTAPTALEWGTDGSGGVITATLPVVATAGDISLPIAGTWSATNNVVTSTSATALEWGGGLVITNLSMPLLAPSVWFDVGTSIEFLSVLSAGVSTTYSERATVLPILTASQAIAATDIATYSFQLPLNFPLLASVYLPAVAINGANTSSVQGIITGSSPTTAVFLVQISGLVLALGATLVLNFPQFTLFNGQ